MILVQLLVAAAAAVVLFSSIAAITRMTPATNHYVRMAFILVAAGAFGELDAIMRHEHVPGVAEVLFICGIGLLTFVDRRAVSRCPLLPPGVGEKDAG